MKVIKENAEALMVLLLILIMLLVVGISLYIMIGKTNTTNNEISLEKEPNTYIESNLEKQEQINQSTNNIIVEDKESKNPTFILDEIANVFNKCKFTQSLKLQGYVISATVIDDIIEIMYGDVSNVFAIKFELNNNILSSTILYDAEIPQISAIKLLLGCNLIDCVGQIKGYPERSVLKVVSSEQALAYTLEKDGVELRNINSNYDVGIKIDLNSEFPFMKK